MKKLAFIVFALCAIGIIQAQEVKTDSLAADTLSVESLELVPLQAADSLVVEDSIIIPPQPYYTEWAKDTNITDIEMRTLDWALNWLDTTDCIAVHDTTTLPDSIYKARLQALPCVIELPYNERVRAFILRYVKRSPKQVARLMRMSEYYFPIFEEALCRYNLPYELKYVPIIESALNPMARSHAGAAGLWQFMPATGKLFGLEINSLVDERMDPIKATDAACRFLSGMYAIYQDWNLVIADTIRTTQRMHLQQVSENLGISMDELRRLNPQYSRDILPGGSTYTLCLPSEKTGQYIDMQDSIMAYKADSLINNRRAEIDMAKVTSITGAYRVNGMTYYTIKRGDTLGGIAKKFHCTVKQLKQWNGLKSDNIREGKKLKICR